MMIKTAVDTAVDQKKVAFHESLCGEPNQFLPRLLGDFMPLVQAVNALHPISFGQLVNSFVSSCDDSSRQRVPS